MRVRRGNVELYSGFPDIHGAEEDGRDQPVYAAHRKVVCSVIGQRKKLRQL